MIRASTGRGQTAEKDWPPGTMIIRNDKGVDDLVKEILNLGGNVEVHFNPATCAVTCYTSDKVRRMAELAKSRGFEAILRDMDGAYYKTN